MHSRILYNGDIHGADEAILKPGQLGLLSGWGVFTTLRISRGVAFAFERHWDRLSRDADLLHVEMPVSLQAARDGLDQLVQANEAQESVARLCIIRSQGGRWEGPGSGAASDWIALTGPLAPWPETVSLSVRENGRFAASPFVAAKTLSWCVNLTMFEDARREGYDEVILLNERAEVTECTSANIFAVLDGTTYTPPLSSGPLPGVTREVMLSELKDAPPVAEKVLTVDDLLRAEEVFITSSTRDLLPVASISGSELAAVRTGQWPVMEQLRGALRRYISDYVDSRLSAT